MLNSLGVEVVTASDGHDAILKFERSAKNEFDMIFMDIQMPIMNGYEATQLIRLSTKEGSKDIPMF